MRSNAEASRTRARHRRSAGVAILTALIAGTPLAVLTAAPALAATTYACPLSSGTVCQSPLTGTAHGSANATADGYQFGPQPGYVSVNNSQQISTNFPFSFSVQVKGVGVPPSAVGDYDVVRGTPGGNWKLEVVARNNRNTAQAACFFNGAKSKRVVSGGPDLTTLKSNWTTIQCTNTGSAIELRVGGVLVKKVTISTGAIPNPGPLLIGAKDTSGGDQYTGFARDLKISAG